MNLILINIYAEGYYSTKEHSGNFLLPLEPLKDRFEEIKEGLKELDSRLYIWDLDGKYSEVKANITNIEIYEEENQRYLTLMDLNNEEFFFDRFEEFFLKFDLDLSELIKMTTDYLEEQDTYIPFEWPVKKSDYKSLKTYAEFLENISLNTEIKENKNDN